MGASAALVLFVLLTQQVATGGPLLRLDRRLDRALLGHVLPGSLAEFLADLGNTVVALPVLLVAAAYAGWCGRRCGLPRWWLPPLAAALALAAVPALVGPLQAALARPAPPGPLAGTTGFYPSGHAATAAVAYGAAALVLLPSAAPVLRRLLVVAALALVLATGPGLVVRGYHWPLDVLGSWCLSAVLLYGVALLSGVARRAGGRPGAAPSGREEDGTPAGR